MAPKRRTGNGPTTKSTRSGQSTLAFHGAHNKVSKPTSKTSPSSKAKKDPALLDALVTETSPTSKYFPTTTKKASAAETPAEQKIPTAAQDDEVEEEVEVEEEPSKTAEELKATSITPKQIAAYWRQKQAERKAPRVHQEGLGLHEMVCRQWDTDGRYGPCMGIARMKRWKRAHDLGLNPPIEVLAVLLREEEDGNGRGRKAYVDELMSSRFIET